VKILTILAIYFYTIILLLIGALMISFSIGHINPDQIATLLESYANVNIKLATGTIGGFLILISFLFAQIMLGRMKREKTIAFHAEGGEVLVSLNAVEDLIRKLTNDIEDIKEARPSVIASKKGIEINLRLALNSEVSIPEFTGKIQELIKGRVQEILGIDEAIIVKIFVAKIINKDLKPKRKKESEEEEKQTPFQRYKK